MTEVNLARVKDLKVGKYVVIDGDPCRVVSIQKSKPGKHGHAKARVDAISLFTGNKKGLLKSVGASCEIPIILKKSAQVIANLGGSRFQFMDLQTYETFEMEVPEEFRSGLEAGKEVELQDVMGKRMITRVKN